MELKVKATEREESGGKILELVCVEGSKVTHLTLLCPYRTEDELMVTVALTLNPGDTPSAVVAQDIEMDGTTGSFRLTGSITIGMQNVFKVTFDLRNLGVIYMWHI